MSKLIHFITFKNLLLALGLMFFLACKKDPDFLAEQNQLRLKWNQGFDDEIETDALTGLQWVLSYIGAQNLTHEGLYFDADRHLILEMNLLELPDFALEKLRFLHGKIKVSEEYRVTGAIDLGRYIALLIGASEHYYALVGMPNKLDNLKENYELKAWQGYVNNSGVSSKDRILSFSNQNGFSQLFIAEEIHPETGVILEYETLDIMANGQVRFGIFDGNGQRLNAADPFISSAGKPGKCMWCHESKIQPLFEDQVNVAGYLTGLQLADTLSRFRLAHITKQVESVNGVDYSESQAHQLTELLYISFMEPSAARLAKEWNISEAEVILRLADVPMHVHGEFPFLGDLYDRNEVEFFAPFSSVPVSTSIREKSEREVNLFE